MSPSSLDDRYFEWLCAQIGTVKSRSKARTHYSLFRQLHETIFVALVDHDENRIADCKELRYEFLADAPDEKGDLDWMGSPCGMLELLIVLSRILAFEMDDPEHVWFWHLIEVLNLEGYNDRHYDEDARIEVGKALDRVIWRTYDPSGHGGFFPLRDAQRDQRKVELWYQLNAYLLEQF